MMGGTLLRGLPLVGRLAWMCFLGLPHSSMLPARAFASFSSLAFLPHGAMLVGVLPCRSGESAYSSAKEGKAHERQVDYHVRLSAHVVALRRRVPKLSPASAHSDSSGSHPRAVARRSRSFQPYATSFHVLFLQLTLLVALAPDTLSPRHRRPTCLDAHTLEDDRAVLTSVQDGSAGFAPRSGSASPCDSFPQPPTGRLTAEIAQHLGSALWRRLTRSAR